MRRLISDIFDKAKAHQLQRIDTTVEVLLEDALFLVCCEVQTHCELGKLRVLPP
jgi:hypothetical protein